jgi:hypothetical protein
VGQDVRQLVDRARHRVEMAGDSLLEGGDREVGVDVQELQRVLQRDAVTDEQHGAAGKGRQGEQAGAGEQGDRQLRQPHFAIRP